MYRFGKDPDMSIIIERERQNWRTDIHNFKT